MLNVKNEINTISFTLWKLKSPEPSTDWTNQTRETKIAIVSYQVTIVKCLREY